MSYVNDALKLANEGFKVIPVYGIKNGYCTCDKGKHCDPKQAGKHPILSDWPNLATSNPKKIKQWFDEYPDANVAVLPREGECIIDIDPRNGGDKTFRDLINPKQIEETPIQLTGGGGYHLLFKGDTRNLGDGIDVKRNQRGYIVVAPSKHFSGGFYRWKKGRAPWQVEPAELPDELKQSKNEFRDRGETQKSETEFTRKQVREALEHIDPDAYEQWIAFGHALKYNYGDKGYKLFLDWTKRSGKFESEEYVEQKWETFDQNRDRDLITVRSIVRIARKNGYRPLTAEFEQGIWALSDVSKIFENEPKPVDWIFENIVPRGKVCILAGAGGSSKSFMSLTLALELSACREFGPFVPKGKFKTLMFTAEEDEDDTARRFHAIKGITPFSEIDINRINARLGILHVCQQDWRLLYHDENGDLQETDRVDYIIEQVKTIRNAGLLIFDPLVAFNGAKENDNAEMSKLMFTLARIARETNTAIMVIHHVSKGGQVTSLNEATQAVVRGASALVDNARGAMLLTRMPRVDAPLYGLNADDAGKYVVLRFVKNNYGPHRKDSVFKIDKGGALLHAPEVVQKYKTVSEAGKVQTVESLRVSILQEIQADLEISQRDMAENLGVDLAKVHRQLKKMATEKYFKRSVAGEYTLLEKSKQLLKNNDSSNDDDEN